jgi:sugar phosphate isomerase/epimerase
MRYGCVITPQQIGAATGAGFDFVELPARALAPEGRHDLAMRSISRALAQSHRPVKVEVFSALLPEDLAIVGPDVDVERLRRYVQRVFTAMWALGGVQVVLGMGPSRRIPAGFPRERAEAQFAQALTFIREAADRNGLDLVLNPLNRLETNLLTSLDECCRFFSDHNVAQVGLLADSYHLLGETEPLEIVVECSALVEHVHVADSGRAPPGQGDFDFGPFFATLRAIGYEGRLSLKCNWGDFAHEAGPALAHVKRLWEASVAYEDRGSRIEDRGSRIEDGDRTL